MPTLVLRLAFFASAFYVTLPVRAADPPPSIEKLVEQLGSPSFPTRERATKALRERSPEALPALRKALESKDEEVRKRAESIIPALEIEEALLPRRVTLNAKDTLLRGVLGEIETQTGQKLTGSANDGGPKVTLAVAGAPFWEAVDALAKATTRTPAVHHFTGKEPYVQLEANGRRSPFINVRGPFRLEATWFHEDRDLELAELKSETPGWRDHRLTLAVTVLAEPRMTLLNVRPAKVVEAVDSEGKSLVGADDPSLLTQLARSQRPNFRGRSNHSDSSDVCLRRASESAKTAKIIRGTIPVKAVVIRKPVIVSAKVTDAAGTTFRAGSESLVITQVQNQGGNNIEVSIRVPYDQTQPQREWHDRFHLEDDAGNKYQMNGRGSSSNGVEYTISMYFSAPFNNKKVGPPTKLIFEDWVVHEHNIPFEFRDVPLP